MKQCEVDGCSNPFYGRGMCEKHYAQWRRKNNPRKCEIDDCSRAYVSHGMCGAHYRRFLLDHPLIDTPIKTRDPERVCTIEGCGEPYRAVGLCVKHHGEMRRSKDPLLNPCHRKGCEKVAYGDGYCATHLAKKTHLKKKYGLTYSSLDEMLDRQNYACAICKSPLDSLSKTTHIDHDHGTGNVREVLCQGCNTGIGLFRESPEFLRAAAEYLEKHANLATHGA